MNDNDYIVLVDENGQPYIAHSLFGNVKKAVRSAASRVHKYIAKWGEGANARYFYTQEELKAAMNQGKQKGKSLDDKRRAAFYETTDKSTGKRNNRLYTDPHTGEHYRGGVSLQKEGLAKSTLEDAKRSLREASTVDDKRRAASEKRIAENEYDGLKGTFEDWRRDYAAKQEYQAMPLSKIEEFMKKFKHK